MRHSRTATFKTSKIKEVCEKQGVPFEPFKEICEKLEGKQGTYNSWLDLTMNKSLYDFELEDGTVEQVPSQLVVENW